MKAIINDFNKCKEWLGEAALLKRGFFSLFLAWSLFFRGLYYLCLRVLH